MLTLNDYYILSKHSKKWLGEAPDMNNSLEAIEVKKKNFTFRITEQLHEQMVQAKKYVNWSGILTDAIERELDHLRQRGFLN